MILLLCPAKSMKIHFIVVYFDFGVLAVFETNCKKNYVIPLSPHNGGRQSPAKIKPNESIKEMVAPPYTLKKYTY